MTYRESHRREDQAFWIGFLAASGLWALVGMVIVIVFEVMA